MGGAHHSISLYLGGSSGSTGIYNLQGGELLVYGPDVIGMFGSFTQTGGIHIAQYELILGLVGSSTGVYDLEGGVLSVASEYLGSDGTGSFTQTGGTHSVYGSLYLGDMWSGASGIYDLQEGQLTVRQSEYVGRSGTGSFS